MPQAAQRRIKLLEVDPDLGQDLPPDVLSDVTRLVTVPLIELDVGPWKPGRTFMESDNGGPVIGCIVADGLVTRDAVLASRVCTQIFGPRDILSLDPLENASLRMGLEFTVLAPARLALLDDAFLAAGQRWPQLLGRMLSTATSQLGRLSAEQTVSQLPRVEDRLIALFWHLADRWGVRRSADVVVTLPLTHETLGRLIGARRPTVSLGLRQLADTGALRRQGEQWMLSLKSVEELGGVPRVRPRRPAPLPDPRPPTTAAHQALAQRLDELRVELATQRARAARSMDLNREIREQFARRRAAQPAERPGDD
jgi:CRP-like cAMP-binding protein